MRTDARLGCGGMSARHITIFAGVWALFVLACYLALAFAAWQLNPGHWTQADRSLLAVVSVTLAPLLAVLAASDS